MIHSHLRRAFEFVVWMSLFFAGESFSFGGSLFGPGLRWAPTNFVPSEIKMLAIVVDYTVQNRANTAIMRGMAASIEQTFSEICADKGYPVVNRSQLAQCEKELELRRLRITDREGAAHAARVLNTSHLLIVTPSVQLNSSRQNNFITGRPESVQKISVRLNCQIMVTETGLQVAACSDSTTVQGAGLAELEPTAARLAKGVAKALPARQTPTLPVSNNQGVPKTR